MSFLLEGFVTDLIRPDGSADRFPEQEDLPQLGCARIEPIAIEEGSFERGIARELAHGEPREVGERGAPVEAPEIDRVDSCAIDQPVARLPIAMRGHERDWFRPRIEHDRSQALDRIRRDAMRCIEQGERLLVHSHFVGVIRPGALGMECGQHRSGLAIDRRIVLGGRTLHQHTGQEIEQQHGVAFVVPMHAGRTSLRQPWSRVVEMRRVLARDMVVCRSAGFDDTIPMRGAQMQHDRVHLPPAQIGDQFSAGQPGMDDRMLFAREPGEAMHQHNSMAEPYSKIVNSNCPQRLPIAE